VKLIGISVHETDPRVFLLQWAPPPNAMAALLIARGFAGVNGLFNDIVLDFIKGAGAMPLTRETASAASLPQTAPSILPRNFCDVQSPANVKWGMGVVWKGRNCCGRGSVDTAKVS
jgi:hypothetical protein